MNARASPSITLFSSDPGLGAEPALDNFSHPSATASAPIGWKNKAVSWHSRPWAHPAAKGGPCSGAGACTHGAFEPRGAEHWRQHFLERYAWNATDPNKPPGARELEEEESGPRAKPIATDEVLLSHPIGETVVSSADGKVESMITSLQTVGSLIYLVFSFFSFILSCVGIRQFLSSQKTISL